MCSSFIETEKKGQEHFCPEISKLTTADRLSVSREWIISSLWILILGFHLLHLHISNIYLLVFSMKLRILYFRHSWFLFNNPCASSNVKHQPFKDGSFQVKTHRNFPCGCCRPVSIDLAASPVLSIHDWYLNRKKVIYFFFETYFVNVRVQKRRVENEHHCLFLFFQYSNFPFKLFCHKGDRA